MREKFESLQSPPGTQLGAWGSARNACSPVSACPPLPSSCVLGSRWPAVCRAALVPALAVGRAGRAAALRVACSTRRRRFYRRQVARFQRVLEGSCAALLPSNSFVPTSRSTAGPPYTVRCAAGSKIAVWAAKRRVRFIQGPNRGLRGRALGSLKPSASVALFFLLATRSAALLICRSQRGALRHAPIPSWLCEPCCAGTLRCAGILCLRPLRLRDACMRSRCCRLR